MDENNRDRLDNVPKWEWANDYTEYLLNHAFSKKIAALNMICACDDYPSCYWIIFGVSRMYMDIQNTIN